jgi:DNA processing protein
MNENLTHWLTATNLPNINVIKIHKWLSHFKSIKKLFHATTEELQCAGISAADIHSIQHPDLSKNIESITWAKKSNCHLITFDDPLYPALLKESPDAPLLLYVAGTPTLLQTPQLAIVGSRNPTPDGRDTAEQFAFCLAQAGLTITSGLALGIDAAAHRGALNANKSTIAVMGTGLEQVYPASHRSLAQEIMQTGAIISEFPPNMKAFASNFPRRNRIISGLSLGTVVIEAALRSGSLITARLASEQGREVFAMPGSIHNPLARGCHWLIRQGAKLVETAADIIEELGQLRLALPQNEQKVAPKVLNLDQKHRDLLTCVGHAVTAIDTIIVRSGLTVSQVSSMLLSLELQGLVNFVSGGYVRAAPNSR